MLGKKIHQLRKDSGMSQEELAAQLTISRQAVSKWELGESMPDTENVVQISKLFGVTADYLLNDDYEVDEVQCLKESIKASQSDSGDTARAIETKKPSVFKNKRLKIAMLIIIPIFIIFTVIAVFLMTRTDYVEIYNASYGVKINVVYSLLTNKGFAIRSTNDSIQVPENKVDEAMNILREHGIPGRPAGGTSPRTISEQQLAKDLREMMIQEPNVENALVAVSEGSVSIILQLTNADKLSDEELSSIVEIIKNTVPDTYSEINLADNHLNSYDYESYLR